MDQPSSLHPLHVTPDTPHPTPYPQLPVLQDKLLIVEDDESTRTQMRWALSQDYEVLVAGDRANALEILKKERPPVVTLDLGLPPHPGDVTEGFAALFDILSHGALIKVIVITGRAEKEHALKAVGQGAYDFFYKPIQVDELKVVLRRAFHISKLEREYQQLHQQLPVDSFEGMLGTSTAIQQVFSTISKVATTNASVLIEGESGTGKELVARAIHQRSSRREGPFVAINCGAIPDALLESELFGHEKGAFTGAHIQRKGRFEMANEGTLFLDEIGELSLGLQVKLLRFLEEQRIERIGGREKILIDARVLAATNRSLKKEIEGVRFREDLYYRLSVVTISLPALRDRREDILHLANAFLQRYARENHKNVVSFNHPAAAVLMNHSWPGNVRELENRVKRAVIMAEGNKVTPEDLDLTPSPSRYEGGKLKEAREDLEKGFVRKALARNRGNVSRAAAELGISRPTLYELMGKFGIKKEKE
jgi:two-component system NtrC family response regulator